MYRFNEMHNIEKIFNFIPFLILLIYIIYEYCYFMIIFVNFNAKYVVYTVFSCVQFHSLASWNGIFFLFLLMGLRFWNYTTEKQIKKN